MLAQTGVGYVILLEGINDIGIPELIPTLPPVGAEDIIAGMKQIIARSRQLGLKVYGGTILPYRGTINFTEAGDAKRKAVCEPFTAQR